MSAMNTLKKFGLEQAFNYVYKDPDKNFIRSWTGQINFPVVDFIHREQ